MDRKKRKKGLRIALVIAMALVLVLGGLYLVLGRRARERVEWMRQTEAALRGQTGLAFDGIPLLPSWGEFTVPDEAGKNQTITLSGSSGVMLVESKSLDSTFGFALAPAETQIEITSGSDRIFNGGLEEFGEFVPPSNGEYRFVITARYEEETFWGDCGYEFLVRYDAQPVFSLSSGEVRQGGVLLLIGENLRSKDVTVTAPYAYQTRLVFTNTGCVGCLPFNFVRQPGAYEITVTYEGETFALPVTVTQAEFDTQYLTMPEATVNATVGNAQAVREYNETIYPLLESFDPVRYWSGTFVQPADGTITTDYGARRITNGVPGNAHAGIDIANDTGTPVTATNGAKVLYSGYLTVSGYTVLLDHGMGLQTLHMHMSGTAVEEGDVVAQGDIIGYIGSTGYSTGPHLHFTMYIGGHAINPWTAFDGTAGFYQLPHYCDK